MQKALEYLLISLMLAVLSTPILAQEAEELRKFTSLEEALAVQPAEVKYLELKRERFTEIPKDVFKFTKLEVLDLSKNKLRLVPTEIAQLQSLKVLNLNKNKLETLPESIGNLKNLEQLIASQNDLSQLPESIGKLTQLKVLDLWSNNLGHLPKSIQTCKKLEVVDFRAIQMTAAEQDAIRALLPADVKIHFSNTCNCD